MVCCLQARQRAEAAPSICRWCTYVGAAACLELCSCLHATVLFIQCVLFLWSRARWRRICRGRVIGLDDVSHSRITPDSQGRTKLERGEGGPGAQSELCTRRKRRAGIIANARAAHARHTHSSCAGETRRPNQLLSHVVDACLALLRLLKMLSKFTESEANKKMMGEKMSGKVIAATSVIASYEERGEGECTPVSTTISTAGGPASPSREWPCSSIACDGCDQHAHRPLAVRACRRTRGRTRYGRKTSPRRPSLLVLMATIEATRSKIEPESQMTRPSP